MAGPAHPPVTDPTPAAPPGTFAQLVARGTGLSPAVVQAWAFAEGGPSDNPLNVGPGRHYGSTSAAAAAVVSLLHTARYAGILRAAKGTDQQQLDAIAISPWDLGKVGPKPRYRALLEGTYTRVTGHTSPPVVTIPGAVGGAVSGAVGDVGGAVTGALGGFESWAENTGLRVLAYLVLTIVAIALFVLGIARLSGVTPRSVLAARAGGGGGGAQSEEIPF